MASEPAPASSAEQNFGASQMSEGEESLSPLEQEVLDEYARLLGNLNNVSPPILSTYPHAPSLRSPLSTPLYPSTPLPPTLRTSSLTPHQVIIPPPHALQQPQRRYPRRSPRIRKENEFGVYAAQGECV